MPDVNANIVAKTKQAFLDRLEQSFRGAFGEIAPGGADVGEEDGVTAERGVGPDHDGGASGRVAGGEKDAAVEVTELEGLVVFPEVVELGAVALHLGSGDFEDVAEGFLDDRDTLADTDQGSRFAVETMATSSGKLLLEVGSGSEVVCLRKWIGWLTIFRQK